LRTPQKKTLINPKVTFPEIVQKPTKTILGNILEKFQKIPEKFQKNSRKIPDKFSKIS